MTEIRLAARPGNRILAGIGLALIGLMLALWIGLTMAVLAAPWGFSWWRTLGLAALFLCTGATWIAFRQLWRETFMRRPRLVVESGRLLVHHPKGLLRAWGAEQKFGLRQTELVRPLASDLKRDRREAIAGLFFLAYLVAIVIGWIVELFTD